MLVGLRMKLARDQCMLFSFALSWPWFQVKQSVLSSQPFSLARWEDIQWQEQIFRLMCKGATKVLNVKRYNMTHDNYIMTYIYR